MSDLTIHVYDSGREPTGQTWTTEELTKDFEVLGFMAPYVKVKRKSDGVVGWLEFQHQPRIYWGWQADE